jgi:hypothetical protein
MSIENTPDENLADDLNRLGYELFRKGSVRRFNPSLFAVRREDGRGWFLVELKQGKWLCDCQVDDTVSACAHVYAALLSSAAYRSSSDGVNEEAEEKETPLRCRYCGSPDISRVGFRYNARGISRRFICNECRRKFSVPYVEPETVVGAPSGTLWLLSQVAMLTSKLNDLLRDLDERIAAANDHNRERGQITNGPRDSIKG